MSLGQFEVSLLSEDLFKDIEIHSFLGLSSRFPVDFFENFEKADC